MKNLWVFAFDFLSPFSKFSKVRSFKEKRERERERFVAVLRVVFMERGQLQIIFAVAESDASAVGLMAGCRALGAGR